jgi:hypothetical protein
VAREEAGEVRHLDRGDRLDPRLEDPPAQLRQRVADDEGVAVEAEQELGTEPERLVEEGKPVGGRVAQIEAGHDPHHRPRRLQLRPRRGVHLVHHADQPARTGELAAQELDRAQEPQRLAEVAPVVLRHAADDDFFGARRNAQAGDGGARDRRHAAHAARQPPVRFERPPGARRLEPPPQLQLVPQPGLRARELVAHAPHPRCVPAPTSPVTGRSYGYTASRSLCRRL